MWTCMMVVGVRMLIMSRVNEFLDQRHVLFALYHGLD